MSKYAAQKWRELALKYERRSRKLLSSGHVFLLGLCETSSEPWNSSLYLLRPQRKRKGMYLSYWWTSYPFLDESWNERATACALLAAIEEEEE